jgi:hypothetical protein
MLFKTGIMPIFDAPNNARRILVFMPNYARAMRKCRKFGVAKWAIFGGKSAKSRPEVVKRRA